MTFKIVLLVFVLDNLKKSEKEMQALLKRVWPKLTKNTLDKIMPKPPRNGRLIPPHLSLCFSCWNAGIFCFEEYSFEVDTVRSVVPD